MIKTGYTSDQSARVIRRTASVCPVCLQRIPAELVKEPEAIYLKKTCDDHGSFEVPVWRNKLDYEDWVMWEEPMTEEEQAFCDGRCAACSVQEYHGQKTCCVILEVTKRCNLHCPFCFARGGDSTEFPSFENLCDAIDKIVKLGVDPLLQLAGGEPTLRDDLPDLIRYAKAAGCPYAQINTNGIRLAEDPEYVRALSESGLDIVFLQFDGVDDEVYRKLRGRNLLQTKLLAIENCDRYRIGVTLVPTIVRGVNDYQIGAVIRKAVELFPAVRSVHFQPVTYLGRYPNQPENDQRYTLDELMADMMDQTGIPESAFLPSRCDHAVCEFHSTFMLDSRRCLVPMTDRRNYARQNRTTAKRNRIYVAEHWARPKTEEQKEELPAVSDGKLVTADLESMDFDTFIQAARTRTIKISAMAFQDAANLDLERLYRCSLHVYEEGKLLPFCGKYLTPVKG